MEGSGRRQLEPDQTSINTAMEATDSVSTVKSIFRVQPTGDGTRVTRTEYKRTEFPEGNSVTTSTVYAYTIYTPQAQVETNPPPRQVDVLA